MVNYIMQTIQVRRKAIRAGIQHIMKKNMNSAIPTKFQVIRTRSRNRKYNRDHGLRFMAQLKDDEFHRMFRISRDGFYKLLLKIRPFLQKKNPKQATNSSGSPISNTTKLAATLRWMAGGSYLDICGLFGLDFPNFFKEKYILWETMYALDRALVLEFSLDPEVLKKNSEDFARLSKGNLQGCVSAIDGWVCVTRQPTIAEVGATVSSYRNRHQCFG